MNFKVVMLLVWFIPIIFMVGLNYYQIEVKRLDPHPYRKNNIAKVVIGFIFLAISGFNVWYAAYQFFSFGTFFDPALNIIRKKSINYTGRKNWTDRFIAATGIPIIMVTFIEFVLATLFMTIYWAEWSGFMQMMNGTYNWDYNWIW